MLWLSMKCLACMSICRFESVLLYICMCVSLLLLVSNITILGVFCNFLVNEKKRKSKKKKHGKWKEKLMKISNKFNTTSPPTVRTTTTKCTYMYHIHTYTTLYYIHVVVVVIVVVSSIYSFSFHFYFIQKNLLEFFYFFPNFCIFLYFFFFFDIFSRFYFQKV